jgi:mono/diheme cytochrome c family protein
MHPTAGHTFLIRICRSAVVLAGLALLPVLAPAAEPNAADAEFFEKEVRPLLIRHCYECHGDVAKPKGGLKLTSRESVLAGGETGPAAVAGKPDESLLISAINYDGLEMPPEDKKLSPIEIARLTRWVERGLPWPALDAASLTRGDTLAENERIAAARRSHWSFQPVASPPLPGVRDPAWPRMPLDRFVLAQLEKHGLAPSPPVDKRTLLRRLSFDLVGLPPTPQEIQNFLADQSNEAVSRVVDRLLASPHYGERWGRHWLDVARYADTKGYVLFQESNLPWSYTYRDYVVRAFNDDLPYDRFILEQIAADQLPLGDDRRPLTALGFLTVGSGFMNNQYDVVDDRIDVVTRGLLGLTVTCARCHDHKYDPIPTRDYYSLYGVLASSVEPTVPPLFEDPPQTETYAAFAAELAQREQKLKEFLDKKFRELVDGARSRVGEYLLTAHAMRDNPPTDDYMLLADGDDLNPTMIVRYQAFLRRTAGHHDPVLAIWHALAGLKEEEFAAQAAATVRRTIAAATSQRPINPLVAGAFLGRPLAKLADAARIYNELLTGADSLWRAEIERASAEGRPPPKSLADANTEALRQILYGQAAPANMAPSDINTLALLPDRPSQGVRDKLVKAIEQWRAEGPAAPPRAMVLEDLPKPIEPRVFVRGNPHNLGDPVSRQFLRVLCDGPPVPFQQGSGRLELARAIASRDNPLTARVIVNRVWLAHFGSALVRTPSDFGLRSEPPTHPALLDYLAANFMEHGWSIKWLHRQIVLSATYQQASDERPECADVDPENIWLWRTNRRRLGFETTRDALLAVAGRLDPTLGGPPVKEIFAPAATRRTIYGYIDRLNLPGIFRTFDFPNPDATSPQRPLTTVPQQALFFMNNPLVIEAAKNMLARTDVTAQTDPAAKIVRLYRLAFGREPSTEELDWAQNFVATASQRPAVWNELAQGLLAANEFVFID